MTSDVEARFERIERNLDSLTTVALQQAERMSELELAMEKTGQQPAAVADCAGTDV